jgi:acyl-CoA hydrolase
MLRAMDAKPPSESFTEMTELVLPQHANAIGTAFGGVIMSWIDICCSIAARRHCGRVCVTAQVDALEFRAPIKVGDIVRLTARLNAAFNTSMEIAVRVERESAATGRPCARTPAQPSSTSAKTASRTRFRRFSPRPPKTTGSPRRRPNADGFGAPRDPNPERVLALRRERDVDLV